MPAASTLENEYVSQKIFDLHLRNMRERANFDKEITDERLDKFQAIMEKNFAEIRAEINDIRGEINEVRSDIKSDIKVLNTEIRAMNDRFDDMKESQNKWFTVFGILFTVETIVAPVAVAVVQHFMNK